MEVVSYIMVQKVDMRLEGIHMAELHKNMALLVGGGCEFQNNIIINIL